MFEIRLDNRFLQIHFSQGDDTMRLNRNLGMLLLAIYMILVGLAGLGILSLGGPLVAILALAAGILLLLNR